MTGKITIHINFFARLREGLDCSSESLIIEENALVSDVVATFVERGGVWQQEFTQNEFLIALNHEITNQQSALKEGDELAFYPPVTGG